MSDLLIEIGEEMERRFGMDVFFWMEYIMQGDRLPTDLEKRLEGLR